MKTLVRTELAKVLAAVQAQRPVDVHALLQAFDAELELVEIPPHTPPKTRSKHAKPLP